MSDRVKLELGEGGLTVQPGASTEATLTVQNTSTIVDQYAIHVDGIDPAWLSISPNSVSLFPGDHATVTISFTPPAATDAAAGSHSFTIIATSQDNPAESTVLEAILTVRPFGDMALGISPEKITGRQAKYRLSITNSGNADIVLALAAKDEEDTLKYSFEWDRITAPAGSIAEVGLDVGPKQARRTGEKEEHHIRVTAAREGREEEEPTAVEAVFEYTPMFGMLPKLPTAKWRWLLILIPIFVALIAFRYCTTQDNKARTQPTPTVPAISQPTPGGRGESTPTPQPTATAVPLPSVSRFSIDREGADYVLAWEVSGADEVTIDGAPVKPADKKPLGPLESKEFELKAKSAGGTVSKRVALVVVPPPTIKSFSVSPDSVKLGDQTTLAWEVKDAKKATIDGAAVDIPSGNKKIKPEQSRDYVLIAENDMGWVVQRVHVNVAVPTPGP